MPQLSLRVQGMTCEHCKRAVESALENVNGIERATVDLDAHTVSVIYDDHKVTLETMKKAIKEEGYEVTEVQ